MGTGVKGAWAQRLVPMPLPLVPTFFMALTQFVDVSKGRPPALKSMLAVPQLKSRTFEVLTPRSHQIPARQAHHRWAERTPQKHQSLCLQHFHVRRTTGRDGGREGGREDFGFGLGGRS